MDARCITPQEAAWYILENIMHDQLHAVYKLSVHLPDAQSIFFEEGQEEEALRKAANRDTTLMAWFKLNQSENAARRILYPDIPENYVWDAARRPWKTQERGKQTTIGRIAPVSPRQFELYHLRLLLLNVPVARSYEELRTVHGELKGSFREAALALDLAVDDNEWFDCMQETQLYVMPRQLRSLFAIILINCNMSVPRRLWNEFSDSMSEDFVHAGHTKEAAKQLALLHIYTDIQAAGMPRPGGHDGLPPPPPEASEFALQNQTQEQPQNHARRGQEMVEQLNDAQRLAYNAIMDAVNDAPTVQFKCFFIDGPGGTGKTFLYTLHLSTFCEELERHCWQWRGLGLLQSYYLVVGRATMHLDYHCV